MNKKEYWLLEGKKKIDSLKEWNPYQIYPEYLLQHYFTQYDLKSIDEALGDLSDAIKDRGIIMYVKMLKSKKVIELPTEEVQSEVVDYLNKRNYRFKILNNKIELI